MEAGSAPGVGTALETVAAATGAEVSRRVRAGTLMQAGVAIKAEAAVDACIGAKVGAVAKVGAAIEVAARGAAGFEIAVGACVDVFHESGVP